MSDELLFPADAWQPAAPPPAPPPREPAWTGVELAVIVLFTLTAMVGISFIALLGWAILAHQAHLRAAAGSELALVGVTLIGQTGGMAAGFLVTWQWVREARGRRIGDAIRWRRLSSAAALTAVLGGAAMMIAVQLLGHVLPMPKSVPMDRLFTPRTAWLMTIYGVGIAPFFEEFFFRGLLYPTLRSTFQEGMSSAELRAWRPITRLLAVLGAGAVLFWRWRMLVFGLGSPVAVTVADIAALALVATAIVPQAPLALVGWVFNLMAGWRQPELLAIVATGTLFGLMHAAQLGWAWAAVLILILVGTVLTMVRARTGSLMASWLVHVAYNGTLFAAQFVTTRGFRHFS